MENTDISHIAKGTNERNKLIKTKLDQGRKEKRISQLKEL